MNGFSISMILEKYKFHTYRIHLHQDLYDRDVKQWLYFCLCVLNRSSVCLLKESLLHIKMGLYAFYNSTNYMCVSNFCFFLLLVCNRKYRTYSKSKATFGQPLIWHSPNFSQPFHLMQSLQISTPYLFQVEIQPWLLKIITMRDDNYQITNISLITKLTNKNCPKNYFFRWIGPSIPNILRREIHLQDIKKIKISPFQPAALQINPFKKFQLNKRPNYTLFERHFKPLYNVYFF